MLKDNIIFYRKKNGLSQEELANRLLVSRQTVSQWETGQTLPTIDNLQRLKEIFGVGLDALLDESASSAAEVAEPSGAEQPAPQAAETAAQSFPGPAAQPFPGPAAQPFPGPAAQPFPGPAAPYAQPPVYQENPAQERFTYTLSEDDVKRGIRSGWAAYLRAPILLMLFPLFVAVTEEDGSLIGAMAFWTVALIVIYSLRWRKRRARLLQILGGRETELLVYTDHLTQRNIKNGETVSLLQIKYNEIRRADDLGTLLRVTDSEKIVLLPKNVIPDGSLLQYRLAGHISKSQSRRHPVLSTLFILGVPLILILAANIYVSVIGSDPSPADMTRYSWIMLIPLPFALALIGYGIYRAVKNQKKSVVMFIVGAVCALVAFVIAILPRLGVGAKNSINNTIAQIEQDAGVDLPEAANIHITNNMTVGGKNRVTQILVLTMDRSVSLAFDAQIAEDPRWITSAQAERLAPVWNGSYVAQNADYVMCVNLTDGTANELPAENGKYRCINLLYVRETETIYVVRYEIDYRQ